MSRKVNFSDVGSEFTHKAAMFDNSLPLTEWVNALLKYGVVPGPTTDLICTLPYLSGLTSLAATNKDTVGESKILLSMSHLLFPGYKPIACMYKGNISDNVGVWKVKHHEPIGPAFNELAEFRRESANKNLDIILLDSIKFCTFSLFKVFDDTEDTKGLMNIIHKGFEFNTARFSYYIEEEAFSPSMLGEGC